MDRLVPDNVPIASSEHDPIVSAVNRRGALPPFESFMSSATGDDTNPKVYTANEFDEMIDDYANLVSNDDEEFVPTRHDLDNTFVIPTPKRTHRNKLVPIIIIQTKVINGVKLPRPLLCLLDSGSTGCLMNRKSMPYGCKTIRTEHATVSTTTQGNYSSDEVVYLEDVQMMEFTNARHIRGAGAHVFDSPTCPYDLILGRDFLRSIGLVLDFQTDTVAWLDEWVNMKTTEFIRGQTKDDMVDLVPQPNDVYYNKLLTKMWMDDIAWQDEAEDEFMLDEAWDNFADEILERK